jgi:hypothetical protein
MAARTLRMIRTGWRDPAALLAGVVANLTYRNNSYHDRRLHRDRGAHRVVPLEWRESQPPNSNGGFEARLEQQDPGALPPRPAAHGRYGGASPLGTRHLRRKVATE